MDILIPLTPAAAIGVEWLRARPWRQAVAAAALAWSILIAGTGAFAYPNDQWNTDPVDVDTNHDRLWEWRDSQIPRCWQRGLSPQNFALFDRAAVRRILVTTEVPMP